MENDGNNPILRAIREDDVYSLIRMLEVNPKVIHVRDKDDDTLAHIGEDFYSFFQQISNI